MDLNRYNYDKNMEIQNDYSLYYVDVVMCIDGSARMKNAIDKVKLSVLSLHVSLDGYGDLEQILAELF